MSAEEEIIVPFPVPREQISTATEYSTSGISASLVILRERGYYERYLERLPAEYHEPILSLVPGRFMPAELARAHYLACDALGLPRDEEIAIGELASSRLYSPGVKMAFKLAAGVGASPWVAVGKIPESWARTLRGGSAVQVVKLGPKEARIEVEGHPIIDIPYVRTSMIGILRHPIGLLCRRVFVRVLPNDRGPYAAVYQASWV